VTEVARWRAKSRNGTRRRPPVRAQSAERPQQSARQRTHRATSSIFGSVARHCLASSTASRGLSWWLSERLHDTVPDGVASVAQDGPDDTGAPPEEEAGPAPGRAADCW